VKFYGNRAVADTLEHMVRDRRTPQTLLFSGAYGVGKATMARRFAARLIGGESRIEKDDLSLPENGERIEEREKWTGEKRAEDPLLFASHPDFVTFPPDGPLRQISIQQMRTLKERAQYKPLKGDWRVFLIDHVDRANEQAANSLLKTLEEPPEHLILILTAENPYDVLPTIRSRSIQLVFAPLQEDEMREFAHDRNLNNADRRLALASGSPGAALSLDLAAYDRRRSAMLALLQAGARTASFGNWLRFSEALGQNRTEKLDAYLSVLYVLLEDILRVRVGLDPRNLDLHEEVSKLAHAVSFDWLIAAVAMVDELVELVRRNIQKAIAMDALVVRIANIQ
jgi:DNA polymerase-3 subunit delta'